MAQKETQSLIVSHFTTSAQKFHKLEQHQSITKAEHAVAVF